MIEARFENGHLENYWTIAGGNEKLKIFIISREKREPKEERIRNMYGLTPRELEIANAISSGMSPYEVGLRDGVSVHTVRNQLKSAMSKLGVRRQAAIRQKLDGIS